MRGSVLHDPTAYPVPAYAGPATGQRSAASAAAAAGAGGAHQTAGGNGAHPAAAAGQPAGSPSHPATPEQWVDAFVAAMAEARDVADARQRAARLLHAFQQAVIGATAGQVGHPHCAGRLSFPCYHVVAAPPTHVFIFEMPRCPAIALASRMRASSPAAAGP